MTPSPPRCGRYLPILVKYPPSPYLAVTSNHSLVTSPECQWISYVRVDPLIDAEPSRGTTTSTNHQEGLRGAEQLTSSGAGASTGQLDLSCTGHPGSHIGTDAPSSRGE